MHQIRPQFYRIGSTAWHTIQHGSWQDRAVLFSIVFTGSWAVKKICSFALRFFKGSQPYSALPDQTPINREAFAQRAQELAAASNPQTSKQRPSYTPSPAIVQPAAQLPDVKLAELNIKNEPLHPNQEADLADALHSYQALKTELNVDEKLLGFLATTYAVESRLPAEDLEWKEGGAKLENTSQFNEAFQGLASKLLKVGLSLVDIQGSDQPLGQVRFIDGSTKNLLNLNDLYETVRLQAPHILTPREIDLKTQEQKEAQKTLFTTRLEIIEKLFSTVKTVLIDEFLASFPKKYERLYPIFESNPEVLRFAVENIYWFALDIALESIEKKFIYTQEKQKKELQAELENNLQKFKLDTDKQKQAEDLIIKILEKKENKNLISSLAALLLDDKQPDQKINPDQEAIVRPLQDADRKLEEQRIENEVNSLRSFQTIYSMFSSFASFVDRAKGAFRFGTPEGQKKKGIIVKPLSNQAAPLPERSIPGTFSHEINNVSVTVTEAGEKVFIKVGNKQGESTFRNMIDEMERIPGISRDDLSELLDKGWTGYSPKQKWMGLTMHQRWLVTRVMILRRLSHQELHKLWVNAVQSVGERARSTIKALYSQLIIALLAFEQRTLKAGNEGDKPADQIVEALINPLIESCEALQKVKRTKGNLRPGEREAAIAEALGRKMHGSAFNNRNADALFLGKLALSLLSMLQLEELSGEMQAVLTKTLTQPGRMVEPTLQKVFEKYNTAILPKAKPWIQVGLSFLFDLVQIYVERQSTSSIADQMSDKLNPLNVNALLIEFLLKDTANITISELTDKKKDPSKWYPEDDEKLRLLRAEYDNLKVQIDEYEKQTNQSKKEDLSSSMLGSELVDVKRSALECYTRLAGLLLRRCVIVNMIPYVPASFTSYVMTLFQDLFELMQYPRILRNIIFHVLENTVQSLAQPLDEKQGKVHLDQLMQLSIDQPALDFLLSSDLKANVGAKILKLIKSISPNENAWTNLGYFTQHAVATVVPGYTLFSILQGRLQALVAKKLGQEANYWTVGKLISKLNAVILRSATDDANGLASKIETQLVKALTVEQPTATVLPNDGTLRPPSQAQLTTFAVVVDGSVAGT